MHPLDNVLWTALGTTHAKFALDAGAARRYHPDVSPLSAVADPESPAAWAAMAQLLAGGRTAGLFLSRVPESTGTITVLRTHPLVQMHCAERQPPPPPSPHRFEDLTSANAEEMVALVKLTQPGPLERRTVELGHYIGVRDSDGRLIAMSGERAQLPGFTEISAVCTHPDHRGKGLAGTLMQHLMQEVFARNEQPFLHVAAENASAQRLYRQLGFVERFRGLLVVVQGAAA